MAFWAASTRCSRTTGWSSSKRFIANGWWTQVAEDARSAVAGDGTVVLMGHVSGQGTLVVKTVRPHELWLDSEMPGPGRFG